MTTVTRPASLVLAGVLIAIVGRPTPLTGKPRPQPLAATAQFRCAAQLSTCPDRIQADVGGAYVATEFNASTNEGASLNINGEFFLNLAVTNPDTTMQGRSLLLDFTNRVGGGSGPLNTLSMQTGYMRTNTLAADGVNLLDGGLLGIPCGGQTQALLLVTFPDPSNSSREWVVRFNPFEYPTSNKVLVTRSSRTSWTITNLPGPGADHAVLVSRTTVRNKLTIVNEGTYAMPFSVDVTVDGATACP